jgi:hypothetical protein
VTPEEAEQLLTERAMVVRFRENRVRAAVGAGVSKLRVSQLTGIGRSTIDRILAAGPPRGPSLAHQEAKMITDALPGARPAGRALPGQERRLGDLNPGGGVNLTALAARVAAVLMGSAWTNVLDWSSLDRTARR